MKFPRVVYALRHDATGKVYVGSTSNLHARILMHINCLKRGEHQVPGFQSDYDQHENKNLSVTVLDTVENWDEKDREYEWMDRYKAHDPRYGYNYLDPHFAGRPYQRKNHQAQTTLAHTTLKTGGAS